MFKLKKAIKWISWTSATLVALVGLLMLISLSRASVLMTPGGVHSAIAIPIIGEAAIRLPIYAGSGDNVAIQGHLDGPVVRMSTDGSWSAKWFCENNVQQSAGRAPKLEIDCAGEQYQFTLGAPAPRPDKAEMPDKVTVLSDLEGNFDFLDKALKDAEIIDAAGSWTYGSGQLVILGDSVDRGRDVFAVLWKLYQLSAQAQMQGGAVRVVLGNHEQYVLRGNFSRAHVDHIHAVNRLGGERAAFGADTVIGKWLRDQPVVLQLGNVMFVHGGISSAILRPGLSLDTINAASRTYWHRLELAGQKNADRDAVFGVEGVTQYRGFIMEVDGQYGKASERDVNKTLDHLRVEKIVVAHTIVDAVTSLYGGKVFAVDVNSDEAKSEVLTFVKGQPRIVAINVERDLGGQTEMQRDFRLSSSNDWALLWSIYRSGQKIGAIPHPY